jgi:hypothetical protein
MANLILLPAGAGKPREHFNKTVKQPIRFDDYSDVIPANLRDTLDKIYPSGFGRLWGAVPGSTNLKLWERITPGDIGLFYAERNFYASVVVTYRPNARYPELAKRLWGMQDGATWECIYFLNDLKSEDISWRDVYSITQSGDSDHLWGMQLFGPPVSTQVIDRWALQRDSANAQQPSNSDRASTEITVTSAYQIKQNLISFNSTATTADTESVKRLLSHTTYWVHDANQDLFVPAKFAGVQGMTFQRYEALVGLAHEEGRVAGFDGTLSRTSIESVLNGQFNESPSVHARLTAWASELIGSDPFSGVDAARWRFISLPAAKRASPRPGASDPNKKDLDEATNDAINAGDFDPDSVEDAREKIFAAITRRRGQPIFRKLLIEAYEGKCAFCGCDAVQALEAAHITPYRGIQTNHPSNGLLLRADLHTLFDLGLMSVNPETLKIVVSKTLRATAYNVYSNKDLTIPDDSGAAPSRAALKIHFDASGLTA